MSGPVDVLAMLDHVGYRTSAEHAAEIFSVRDAVAELIDSMPALIDIAAGRTPVALGVIRRAEAALARVQGKAVQS